MEGAERPAGTNSNAWPCFRRAPTTITHLLCSWLAECLADEPVPAPFDLEEALRSGVLLAKLAHFFAPDLVPREKIFDIDEVGSKVEAQFSSGQLTKKGRKFALCFLQF